MRAFKRRSRRVPAKHPLMLTILGSNGEEVLKEFVSTVELSKHGARIRGRQVLPPDGRGILVQLKTLRRAAFRVAWPSTAPSALGYIDTGVELIDEFEHWETFYTDAKAQTNQQITGIENPTLSAQELFQSMLQSSFFDAKGTGRVLERVWCSLVEQLEERKILSRADLVTSLRKISEI